MRDYFDSTWRYLALGLVAVGAMIASQSFAGFKPPEDTGPNDPLVAEAEVADVDVAEIEVPEVDMPDAPEVDMPDLPEVDMTDAPEADMTDQPEPEEDAESEIDQLEERSEELAEQAREAKQNKDTDQYNQLRAELDEVVKDHFEQLESRRRQQVEALEARLKALQAVLKQRAEHADEIVARRVKTLLGETDALDWNPQSPGVGRIDPNGRYFEMKNSWLDGARQAQAIQKQRQAMLKRLSEKAAANDNSQAELEEAKIQLEQAMEAAIGNAFKGQADSKRRSQSK